MDRGAAVVVLSWMLMFCCGLARATGDGAGASASSNTGKTWIVCVSGYDLYKYTYGFEAGVYNLCNKLAGKSKENLIIISPDSAAYHVRNSVPGKVVHGKRTVEDEFLNVYETANITYKSEDMTTDIFFGILSGNKKKVKGIGSEKVVQSGPQDTIILVFINIGDYGVMTLTNNQYLWAEKLIPFLEDLQEANKFKQMLILVDGQNAGSMFDGYLCEDCNIIAMTNTAKQDDLELCSYNGDVSAYTATCYTLFLTQHLEKLMTGKEAKTATLFDLYQGTRQIMWFSDAISNLYGQLDMGNRKLSSFF